MFGVTTGWLGWCGLRCATLGMDRDIGALAQRQHLALKPEAPFLRLSQDWMTEQRRPQKVIEVGWRAKGWQRRPL